MKNSIVNFFMFALGAAVGSFATWKLLNKKYEDSLNEESKSLKEMYSRHYSKRDGNYDRKDDKPEPSVYEIKEYLNNIKQYNKDEEKKEVLTVVTTKEPYIIEPGEFGEEDDYTAYSLTYYADGVITDEWDNVIENPDAMIGSDALNHFGEYEADSVFVRNDDMKSDFEILMDIRNYADIPDKNTHDYTLDDE